MNEKEVVNSSATEELTLGQGKGLKQPLASSEQKHVKKPLEGEELRKYVEGHKAMFQGNGDALCVGAGYGDYSEDGVPHCDFPKFVKELDKAVELAEDVEKKQAP